MKNLNRRAGMKTMRSIDGKRIWRATDERASQLYADGEANYATKEEWKKEVRDVNKNPNDDVDHYTGTEPKKTHNKMSKAQKRQIRKTL